jgi:hypothetical protein
MEAWAQKKADRKDVEGMLANLRQERAENKAQWLEVGRVLHAIDSSMLGLWLDWTEQMDKRRRGHCLAAWNAIRPRTCADQSLHVNDKENE